MPKHSTRYYGALGGSWENSRKALGATQKVGKKKKYSNQKWKDSMNFSSAFGER